MKKQSISLFILFILFVLLISCNSGSTPADTSEDDEEGNEDVLGGWVYCDSSFNPILTKDYSDNDRFVMREFQASTGFQGFINLLDGGFFEPILSYTSPGYSYSITGNKVRITCTSSGAYIEYNIAFFNSSSISISTTSSGGYFPYYNMLTTSGYFKKATNYTR